MGLRSSPLAYTILPSSAGGLGLFQSVMQIFHRGIVGGWNIEAMDNFAPEIICGIFVFCKYIEQENEF